MEIATNPQANTEAATIVEAEAEQTSAQELEQLLAAARERLDGYVRDLRAVDGELDGLATERKRHELLANVCTAIDQLERSGGSELLWGRETAAAGIDARLHDARERLTAFNAHIAEIEGRRRAVLEEIEQQEAHAELLEDDVYDALNEEERRKHEWIVEREIDADRAIDAMETWKPGEEDERRFRKSLASSLMTSLAFALVVPFIKVPTPEEAQPIDVPQRIVTMMLQDIPKPRPVQTPVPPPQQVAEQKPVEKPVPRVPTKIVPQEPKPEDVEGPAQGILAFREKLDAFKDTPLLARLGSQARIDNSDQSSVARPERSMLTTNAPGSSGGIKLAALSRDFGSGGDERGAIQGAALTRASSKISAAGSDRPLSDGAALARTDEEIQIVFDRHKAELYRLYNRELRRDPTLQGKMILRLTIEPDGSVTYCALQATDMNAPDLAAQVVARVHTFDFGAKAVPAITIVYPIDFLPAA